MSLSSYKSFVHFYECLLACVNKNKINHRIGEQGAGKTVGKDKQQTSGMAEQLDWEVIKKERGHGRKSADPRAILLQVKGKLYEQWSQVNTCALILISRKKIGKLPCCSFNGCLIHEYKYKSKLTKVLYDHQICKKLGYIFNCSSKFTKVERVKKSTEEARAS